MLNKQEVSFPLFQLVNEQGEYSGDIIQDFDPKLLVELYEWMLRVRQYDSRLLKMQRQGRIGTYAPFRGQEAAQIGSAFALEKEDWIFPSYRDLAACLVHGMPLSQIIKFVKGHFDGGKTPEGVNVFPVQIIIAAQTLHATGNAWASKLKGERKVTVSYFGDGATSEGDFHEALNFASVYQVPVIFFCQNNHWAISVPLEKQMASETIAQKALAYGMKGIRVDGNDCLAVYKAMKESIESARSCGGPILIEAVTYRQGPHTTADDPTKYRSQDEVERWISRKDPIARLKTLLSTEGLWSEEKEASLLQEVNLEMTRIVEEVEQLMAPAPHEIFNHVFTEPNPMLAAQQREMKERGSKKGAIRIND